MDESIEKTVVTLCGVQGCCPSVEFVEDRVVIRDDFGGSVQLTRKQWEELLKIGGWPNS